MITLLLALGLTACGSQANGEDGADTGSVTRISPARAAKHYQPVARKLARRLESKWSMQPFQQEGKPALQDNGQGCRWYLTLRSSTWIQRNGSWHPVIAAVNQVLGAHDFDRVQGLAPMAGGYRGLVTNDSKGARLQLSAKGTTTIDLAVPVSAGCQ